MKRIEWIDGLRAFAILCVVFGHIEVFSMAHYGGLFHRMQNVFCMPLFFFLSGFFAKHIFHYKGLLEIMQKKTMQLLVPFLCLGSLYTFLLCKPLPIWSLLYYPQGESHNGYWFLLVLFEVYFLFCLGQLLIGLISKIRVCSSISGGGILIHCVIWLLLLVIVKLHLFSEDLNITLSYNRIWWNYPFFIFGYAMMRYEKLRCFIGYKETFSLVFVLFFICFYLEDSSITDNLLIRYVMAFSGIICLLYLFERKYDNIPAKKAITYVGQRTLEIYVLHFFFLPRNLSWLNTLVAPDGVKDRNISIELFVCLLIAILVIMVTLLVAKILKETPILSKVFLGK